MCGFAKRKDQNLFGFLQICNGTAGKDRNSQPVYNGFLNAFQIIHPGNDVQITRDDPIFFEKQIHLFFGSGPFFTDDDRIFGEIAERNRLIRKMTV